MDKGSSLRPVLRGWPGCYSGRTGTHKKAQDSLSLRDEVPKRYLVRRVCNCGGCYHVYRLMIDSKHLREKAQQLIGAIAINFMQCELCAALLVDHLTNSNDGTKNFETKKNTAVKLECHIKRLKRHQQSQPSTYVDEAIQWLEELKNEYRELRNEMVHSLWTWAVILMDGKPGFPQLFRRKDGTMVRRVVALDDFKATSEKIMQALSDGVDLSIRIIPEEK